MVVVWDCSVSLKENKLLPLKVELQMAMELVYFMDFYKLWMVW